MQSNHRIPFPRPPAVNGHRAEPRGASPHLALGLEVVVESLGPADEARDVVQEWGEQSFPASDPPSNW
jgi:hypothetical protein